MEKILQGLKQTVPLANGAKMPIFGLGTWQSQKGEVGAAVKTALEYGYTHIDCAHVYENEAEIGNVLAPIFAKGDIKREDIFVTSKLWNTSHKKEQVKPAVKKTLENLQLEYLDLYLIHFPVSQDPETKTFIDVSIQETWRAMEELVDEGLVKNIGVSNFASILVKDILSYAKIAPAVSQVERHPYLTIEDHVEFCKKNNIVVTAYGPLGAPGNKNEGLPHLLGDEVVVKIAEKYGKTPAQILIRFPIEDDIVVIPKTVNLERIKENADVWDFQLTSDEVTQLKALDRNVRYYSQKWVGVNLWS